MYNYIVIASRIPPGQIEVRDLVFDCSWAGILLGNAFWKRSAAISEKSKLETKYGSHALEFIVKTDFQRAPGRSWRGPEGLGRVLEIVGKSWGVLRGEQGVLWDVLEVILGRLKILAVFGGLGLSWNCPRRFLGLS